MDVDSPRSDGTLRVLVVEDHADSRELLVDFLEMQGYAVDVALHGLEALARLRAGPRPDVVLLDLMMPRLTGWELMEHVRDEPVLACQQLAVVVVSGAGPSRPLPQGIRAALPKPLDLDALVATLGALQLAPPQA
ncbi:response regulator [Aggregicoccus sp. 17bor-14]|uniref:response regulator n=1 Tax=Myxococcaceae TaxID=31 RepID=UPI00129C7E2E|nr:MULTISPECIES: response regulator [Myxococcaceae]MBF5046012.1 response regulator [Simulacricoccus sp. 17bor-14]MRI91743.1 response regulator [Aggregicoccus sp. 17bor-14]